MSRKILEQISKACGNRVKTVDGYPILCMRQVNLTIEMDVNGDDTTMILFEPITRRCISIHDINFDNASIDVVDFTDHTLTTIKPVTV